MRALSVFITLAWLAACNARSNPTSADTPTSAQSATAADRAEVTIPVDGMSCSACAARLKRGLRGVDGVLDVDVTLHPGAARIGYLPSKTDPPRLAAAINALEFTAGTPSPSTAVR